MLRAAGCLGWSGGGLRGASHAEELRTLVARVGLSELLSMADAWRSAYGAYNMMRMIDGIRAR